MLDPQTLQIIAQNHLVIIVALIITNLFTLVYFALKKMEVKVAKARTNIKKQKAKPKAKPKPKTKKEVLLEELLNEIEKEKK